ncbi:MAG: PEP-CTERM sorting domain-containing protein [Rubrivivax sp.]|nr:PEP-CTERM sorting domain-containing protein [Rubrivivax sp.]
MMKKTSLKARSTAICKALTASFVLASSAITVHAAPIDFNYTGAMQTFTVLASGSYSILGLGAQGGFSGSGVAGGKGAQVGATFSLLSGHVLNIYVGGQGGLGGPSFGGYGGGGGGGSWVYNATTSSLLLVAGGGGGGYTGNVGGAGLSSLGGGGFGGTGSNAIGGGGGGFNGPGASAMGGAGFPTLTGGNTIWGGGAKGGFGGGGASGGYGAGGGGGFNGGNAGIPSTGGTSFVAPTGAVYVQSDGFSSSTSHGLVQITSISAVPEPQAYLMMALGLAGLVVVAKRRKANQPAQDKPDACSAQEPDPAAPGLPRKHL